MTLTLDDAVRKLRRDPQAKDLVRNSYLDWDSGEAAKRFARSSEFSTVLKLLGGRLSAYEILDLGAGTGIAAAAFVRAGAKKVIAVEPDGSDEVGRGAARRHISSAVTLCDGVGEELPVADTSIDVVYTRQVLHHTSDLRAVMREVQRVLRPNGIFLATREHVVDSDQQLAEFLENHPIHRLAGGENAYRLAEYLDAIHASGLHIENVIGPWDSVINAFPAVRSQRELDHLGKVLLRHRFPRCGHILCYVPGIVPIIEARARKQRFPGRLYSFLARRPGH